VDNDIARGADALLEPLLAVSPGRGTDFAAAMREAQRVMELNWSADRAPVVVFLSDGEAPAPSEEVRSICNMAVSLGQPLSFHTVFFGARSHSAVLDYMAAIAAKIYGNASPRTLSDIPCGSHYAIDSIQLAQTFLNIADSMRQVRVSAGASF
ncbi:uncharacterized protein EI90DRAFT_2904852, partial [Cantharellus anzutake]|uniref:uncharacterized protein n=1 Tax=Cantharellus anzutake TaxID=1750568 RepID=UPI0019043447